MKSQEVTALREAIRSDASRQIAGFLYQFVVALEYCFKLSSGQSLYIEKYGDVAIKNDGTFDGDAGEVSVEVKMYADELNESHHNLLNTLYNWLEDDFVFESYQTLIIYTTQPIANKSKLVGWNDKCAEDKAKVLIEVYRKYLNDNREKIADKDVGKYKTIKKNAEQMNRVLESVKDSDGKTDETASKKRLEDLLKRVVIYDSSKNLEQKFKDLLQYAKVAASHLQETFIDSLLGFIIGPNNMKDGWKIDETTFARQVQLLAVEMAPQSISFPDAPDVKVEEGAYVDSLFVQKLKEIEYKDITNAVLDFAKTVGLLTGEFSRPSAEKNLADYQNELLNIYGLCHGNAVDELAIRNEVTSEIIKNLSRVFLRTVLLEAKKPKFAPFGVTKSYFSNGMCHYMANDSAQNIKWLLSDE
jgi:hypothetical protein